MEDLPSTTIKRERAAAVFHSGNKTLMVSGGWHRNGDSTDSIEMLKIDTHGNDTPFNIILTPFSTPLNFTLLTFPVSLFNLHIRHVRLRSLDTYSNLIMKSG